MVGYQIYKNEKWDCSNYSFREQTALVISESADSAQGEDCFVLSMHPEEYPPQKDFKQISYNYVTILFYMPVLSRRVSTMQPYQECQQIRMEKLCI